MSLRGVCSGHVIKRSEPERRLLKSYTWEEAARVMYVREGCSGHVRERRLFRSEGYVVNTRFQNEWLEVNPLSSLWGCSRQVLEKDMMSQSEIWCHRVKLYSATSALACYSKWRATHFQWQEINITTSFGIQQWTQLKYKPVGMCKAKTKW